MSMKPQELRIGNIINGIYHTYDDGDNEEMKLETTCTVATLDQTGASDYPIWVYSDEQIEHFSEFERIPLTEEWLSKFEFEHVETRGRWIKDKFVIWKQRYLDPLSIFEQNKFYLQTIDYEGNIFTLNLEIKYVHQLQNLYYCFCGEELKLKSSI